MTSSINTMTDIEFFEYKLVKAESRRDGRMAKKLVLQLELLKKAQEISLLQIEYDALEAKYNLL